VEFLVETPTSAESQIHAPSFLGMVNTTLVDDYVIGTGYEEVNVSYVHTVPRTINVKTGESPHVPRANVRCCDYEPLDEFGLAASQIGPAPFSPLDHRFENVHNLPRHTGIGVGESPNLLGLLVARLLNVPPQ